MSGFESDFESGFKSDFKSNFESDFKSDFESNFVIKLLNCVLPPSDNLISLSYSMPAFSANTFRLFSIHTPC